MDDAQVQRLTSIGLPPRPAGWVPAQSMLVASAESSPDPDPLPGPSVPATKASSIDAARLALASRLPDWAALRVERMSASTFAASVAAAVALVIAVAVGVHRHHDTSYPSYAAAPSGTSDSTSASDAGFDGSSLVVDVEGKVRHAGLVTLPIGARVADAIKAAGGARRHRDLAGVDLAQRVADGELLTIGRRHGHGSAGTASKLVHLSTASLAKLQTLPGVGPVTAQKIIDWRSSHGGFTSVSQLQQVSGIGPARYAELSPLVAP